jgi:hypothetical protein
MSLIISALWTAGSIQLAIAAANLVLPKKLNYREHLPRMSPVIRQIFVVHSVYIVGVVLFFAAVTFLFAPELSRGAGLGRFLAGAICLFWFGRVPVQLFFYGPELRKQNPVAHWAFASSGLFLSIVYGAAAFGIRS